MSEQDQIRKSPSGPILDHPIIAETLQDVVDQSNILRDGTALADNVDPGELYTLNYNGNKVLEIGGPAHHLVIYQSDGISEFLRLEFNEVAWWGNGAVTAKPVLTGNINGNTALASLIDKLGSTNGSGFFDDSAVTNTGGLINIARLYPQDGQAIAASAPSVVTEEGTGSPAIPFIYASYPQSVDRYMDWNFKIPAGYVTGATLLVTVYWMSETTPGNCDFEFAFAAMSPGDSALSKSLVLSGTANIAATNGIGKLNQLNGALSGADLDGAVAGDWCVFRLGRLGSNILDTLTTGAVKVLMISVDVAAP